MAKKENKAYFRGIEEKKVIVEILKKISADASKVFEKSAYEFYINRLMSLEDDFEHLAELSLQEIIEHCVEESDGDDDDEILYENYVQWAKVKKLIKQKQKEND